MSVRQHKIDNMEFDVTFERGGDNAFIKMADVQQWLLEVNLRPQGADLPMMAAQLGKMERAALKQIKQERRAAEA